MSPAPIRRIKRALIRRVNRAAPAPVQRTELSRSGFAAVSVLGVLLLGIIGVAFRGSWTAHRDAALAAHFDPMGANLYPFAPDGLIVIALIAAMVLRHDTRARLYSLAVVGTFTISSYLINHMHGLGWFAADPASGHLPTLNWVVVGLIAGQLIGAMFFGSHLLVYVLRHMFPGTADDQQEHLTGKDVNSHLFEEPSAASETVPDAVAEPDPEDVARKVYGVLLDLDQSIGRDKLAKVTGVTARAAVRIRKEVEAEREEADLAAQEAAEAKASADLLQALALPTDEPDQYAVNGHPTAAQP